MVHERVEEEGEEVNEVMERGRRRGRWAHIKSLEPYTKFHLLTRMLTKLDPEVLRRGAYLERRLKELGELWVREFEAMGRPLTPEQSVPDHTRGRELDPPDDFQIPEKYRALHLDASAENNGSASDNA